MLPTQFHTPPPQYAPGKLCTKYQYQPYNQHSSFLTERCLPSGPWSNRPEWSAGYPTVTAARRGRLPRIPATATGRNSQTSRISEPVDVKKKKKIRRGRGGKHKIFAHNDKVNKWMIYHLNIRGWKTKSTSLCSIIN